jgi:hypothetical protein
MIHNLIKKSRSTQKENQSIERIIMDARQQAHTKMLITTRDVLDSFKLLWQGIVAFVTARTLFGAAIKAIQDQELQQAGTTTGGTEDKHTDRAAMCDAAVVVGGAVAQWAETQGNHELYTSVDYSAAQLIHLPEQECATVCQNILNAGIANLAAMAAGQTLAQTDLDDLQEKINQSNKSLTRPRQLRTKISGATGQLPGLITAADRIAERQLDKLMEKFKTTQPDFYAAYQVARVIVSQGGGSSAAPIPTPAPATQTGTTQTPAATPAATGTK